jgi:hypothetical protein
VRGLLPALCTRPRDLRAARLRAARLRVCISQDKEGKSCIYGESGVSVHGLHMEQACCRQWF